jgi:ankyrin repeat protein
MRVDDWFSNCGGWRPAHSLDELRAGIDAGLLDVQDEYGMTALSLAVMSAWKEGVDALLAAGADTELRYHRTGQTALHMAVCERNEPIIQALVQGGANPDAANHWGITPRKSRPASFERVPARQIDMPPPLIQNAEHLAEQHHPHFEIPGREEREELLPGEAVDVYVYGPKSSAKQDTVKVRIAERRGDGAGVRYVAAVVTPLDQTHLAAGTRHVEIGPENVATIYLVRPSTSLPQ